MNQYAYDGPVMEFDTCVADRWKGSTYAVSENKARTTEFRVQESRFLEKLL